MLSERSERERVVQNGAIDLRPEPEAIDLGPEASRAGVAADLAARGGTVDADRIAIAPSTASIWLALAYVLADGADEVLVSPSVAPAVRHALGVMGLGITQVGVADDAGASLFETASERSRAIVWCGDETRAELVELLSELDLPLIVDETWSTGLPTLSSQPVFASERAPLGIALGRSASGAWLAASGPADRAEPFLARLELHASAFFPSVPSRDGARTNLAALRVALEASAWSVAEDASAGRALLCPPSTRTCDQWRDALRAQGVIVGLDALGAQLAVSLDVSTDRFAGAAEVLSRVAHER